MNKPIFEVVELEQGSEAWRQWRHTGIGASDAPTIMGENPFKNVEALLKEKQGVSRDPGKNAAMATGIELEPIARKLYIAKIGKVVRPTCVQSTQFSWLRASLDGLSSDYDTVVEIKCGKSAYQRTAKTGAVPEYYYGQLQHILAVTGLNSLDYWCYFPQCSPLHVSVPRNTVYIEELLKNELEFWRKVIGNS